MLLFWLLLLGAVDANLQKTISALSLPKESPSLIQTTSYDLQIQLPLSETDDPTTPLFTAHVAMQFMLTADVGLALPFVSDDVNKGARLEFKIDGLDHFENVSLVFNGTELSIANVILTDNVMEVIVAQPMLFAGRYTMAIGRYKGVIGTALFYRDAGEHAVFGSSLFPNHAGALFPVVHSVTNKVTMSLSVVHPLGTLALSSASSESTATVDDNWQLTTFRPTISIVPATLALALLPSEYSMMENSYTGITVAVYYNRFRVKEAQAKQLLNLSTQVLGLLKQFFSSSLAMAKLDLIFMNDIQPSPSFGSVIIPEGAYANFDFSNQIFHVTQWIARHWIGGLVSASSERQLCLQEDLLAYIGYKVVKRMTNDEMLRLAHYVKVELTESIFEPGQSLMLDEEMIDEPLLSAICGLKGVVHLESLERIIGEQQMFSSINELVFHSRSGAIDASTFSATVNQTVDDHIQMSQVFLFWRTNGGLPAMDVDRWENALRLKQRDDGVTVRSGVSWERMPLWPLPLEFTEFKLPVKLIMSKGVHLAPVREGLSLANLGFHHFYRVNYDMDSWKIILRRQAQNASAYTLRERAQLTSDFCHFYSLGVLSEPAASMLRDEWLRLIQLRSADFPLCEATALRCVVSRNPKTPLTPAAAKALRKRIFDSLTSSGEMTCGRGAAHDAINQLCVDLHGKSCF